MLVGSSNWKRLVFFRRKSSLVSASAGRYLVRDIPRVRLLLCRAKFPATGMNKPQSLILSTDSFPIVVQAKFSKTAVSGPQRGEA